MCVTSRAVAGKMSKSIVYGGVEMQKNGEGGGIFHNSDETVPGFGPFILYGVRHGRPSLYFSNTFETAKQADKIDEKKTR